jgi:RNA polymerase sigma-70 factor (ECF subfamily)
MSDEPTTRASLLLRLRNLRDAEAWSQFVSLYLPIVFKYLRRHGLQDADAADVAQEVLRSVATALPGFDYDPARGSFRGWLLTVTRSRAATWWQARRRQAAPQADSILTDRLDQEALESERPAWEEDFRQSLLALAMERVRPTVKPATWQAFWRTNVEHHPAEAVAAELGMTLGTLYVARSRVLARLRAVVRELESQES